MYADENVAVVAAAGNLIVDDPLIRTDLLDSMWVIAMPIDDGGRRQDSCTAYIMPLMDAGGACASTLKVIQSATVCKIVTEGGWAVGAQCVKMYAPDGQQDQAISAAEEVISAACRAVPHEPPRLLQLSDIGPSSVLNSLGVDAVLDLPVEEDNLVCHSQTAA